MHGEPGGRRRGAGGGAPSDLARLLVIILPGGLMAFFHEADALLAEGKTSHQAMTMLAGRHDCIPLPWWATLSRRAAWMNT